MRLGKNNTHSGQNSHLSPAAAPPAPLCAVGPEDLLQEAERRKETLPRLSHDGDDAEGDGSWPQHQWRKRIVVPPVSRVDEAGGAVAAQPGRAALSLKYRETPCRTRPLVAIPRVCSLAFVPHLCRRVPCHRDHSLRSFARDRVGI